MNNGLKTKIWEDFREERRENAVLNYLSIVSLVCLLASFPAGLLILLAIGLQRGQLPYPRLLSLAILLFLLIVSYVIYKSLKNRKSLNREKTLKGEENGN